MYARQRTIKWLNEQAPSALEQANGELWKQYWDDMKCSAICQQIAERYPKFSPADADRNFVASTLQQVIHDWMQLCQQHKNELSPGLKYVLEFAKAYWVLNKGTIG